MNDKADPHKRIERLKECFKTMDAYAETLEEENALMKTKLEATTNDLRDLQKRYERLQAERDDLYRKVTDFQRAIEHLKN